MAAAEDPEAPPPRRLRVRVEGTVQGVGFRPFVHRLATARGLVGRAWNDGDGVVADVQGGREALDGFLRALEAEAPPLARVTAVRATELPPGDARAFALVESRPGAGRRTALPPDMGTCDACLAEVLDPADRRHGYAFTNCTRCGPRLTVVRDLPYDRAATTLAGFPLCPDCAREYADPADRRFHAEPTACPACGPRLALLDAAGRPAPGDPLREAARRLARSEIVAVKGLGGYHLAALAGDEAAVDALRARKHREEKPFAMLAADLDAAGALVALDEQARALLADPRRPIVLLPRRPDAPVAPGVAPRNRELGVMLPYTPLHHLLAREVARPLVLTSGNRADEPIACRDEDALARLGGIADAFLTHDRPIHVRVDDSVVRPFRGGVLLLRRARGYAPAPIRLPRPLSRPVLACGAELKATICVARGQDAFLSQHLGDLEHHDALVAFREAVAHYQRLFDVRPAVVAHDLHPELLSTKWALAQPGVELVAVQHHHAHVAACLADNGEAGPAIGLALDGLGLGPDGTLWGGEVLVADLRAFERVGHLAAVPMPGGAAAIREPWRMAAAWLDAAFEGAPPDLPVRRRNAARWEAVRALAARPGPHAPLTSSAGRLFDAVAALLDLRDAVAYEGQAAVELEQLADPSEGGTWPVALAEAPGAFQIAGADLVRAAALEHRRGEPVPAIAARFHRALADALAAACARVREERGLGTVALSGGVFQNALFTARLVERLEADGFRVLTHRQVPPNDGGLSLGQAVIAGG